MKVTMQVADDYSSSEQEIKQYAREKIRSALKHTQRYVEEISLRLSSLNGYSYKTEKMCFVQMSIPGQAPVYVRSTDSNVYTAIDEALDRAGQKCQRRIRRRRLLVSGGRLKSLKAKEAYRSNPLFASYQSL